MLVEDKTPRQLVRDLYARKEQVEEMQRNRESWMRRFPDLDRNGKSELRIRYEQEMQEIRTKLMGLG